MGLARDADREGNPSEATEATKGSGKTGFERAAQVAHVIRNREDYVARALVVLGETGLLDVATQDRLWSLYQEGDQATRKLVQEQVARAVPKRPDGSSNGQPKKSGGAKDDGSGDVDPLEVEVLKQLSSPHVDPGAVARNVKLFDPMRWLGEGKDPGAVMRFLSDAPLAVHRVQKRLLWSGVSILVFVVLLVATAIFVPAIVPWVGLGGAVLLAVFIGWTLLRTALWMDKTTKNQGIDLDLYAKLPDDERRILLVRRVGLRLLDPHGKAGVSKAGASKAGASNAGGSKAGASGQGDPAMGKRRAETSAPAGPSGPKGASVEPERRSKKQETSDGPPAAVAAPAVPVEPESDSASESPGAEVDGAEGNGKPFEAHGDPGSLDPQASETRQGPDRFARFVSRAQDAFRQARDSEAAHKVSQEAQRVSKQAGRRAQSAGKSASRRAQSAGRAAKKRFSQLRDRGEQELLRRRAVRNEAGSQEGHLPTSKGAGKKEGSAQVGQQRGKTSGGSASRKSLSAGKGPGKAGRNASKKGAGTQSRKRTGKKTGQAGKKSKKRTVGKKAGKKVGKAAAAKNTGKRTGGRKVGKKAGARGSSGARGAKRSGKKRGS